MLTAQNDASSYVEELVDEDPLLDKRRDDRSGLLAKTRTSLKLIVHVGAVFICPRYVHGPSDRTRWKVIEMWMTKRKRVDTSST